jgi:[acyl-carrier-protein] S-malonyltransferase
MRAFLFPGQGSQHVGMAHNLYTTFPSARAVFEQADGVLSMPLSRLCFEGPEEELNDTYNTQPAILAASVAALRALDEQGLGQPAYVAGHSLGEFSALVAAGALSFEDGLRVVRERGRLMKQADDRSPGGMAAIIALDREVVEKVCADAQEETGEYVGIANDNCPGQIVISGTETALEQAMAQAQKRGAKVVKRLAVSIAAHSPLMAPAQARFDRAIEAAEIKAPKIPIYGNVSARALRSAGEVRADLAAQLTSRVRWTESIQGMIQSGVTTFAELGSGSVLIGLVRRIDRSPTTYSLDAPESFAVFSE